MVFDVPAESGGALTILKEFYLKTKSNKDVNWIFVISNPIFEEMDHIKVLRFPWIKKSWLHRLYFDHFVAHKIVKKYEADEIISLQNVIVPKVRVPQILYVHQPLPFSKKRYKITENLMFWVYQNLIGKKIFNSIRKANRVIVQTNWMKDACIEKVKTNPDKIIVQASEIKLGIKEYFKSTEISMRTFFYPVKGYVYKNHKIIIDAALLLKNRGINNYKVIFTLKGNENKHIINLYNIVVENKLPIQFIGEIPLEQVQEYYSKSVLIFPSYIESFGLPMLEARLHRSPVLASDCPFSHEILDGYENVKFFNETDSELLANYMDMGVGE